MDLSGAARAIYDSELGIPTVFDRSTNYGLPTNRSPSITYESWFSNSDKSIFTPGPIVDEIVTERR